MSAGSLAETGGVRIASTVLFVGLTSTCEKVGRKELGSGGPVDKVASEVFHIVDNWDGFGEGHRNESTVLWHLYVERPF